MINRTIQALLACLKVYREESEKLYNELVKYGYTNRFYELLIKRLSILGKDGVAQNVVIGSDGMNTPATKNTHGADYVSESHK